MRMQPAEATPKRADRSGWRRIAKSFGRWELVVTLANCTQGEIFEALQRACFLRVPADEDLGCEWETTITLAGESPEDLPERPQRAGRSQTYMDKMMRATRR